MRTVIIALIIGFLFCSSLHAQELTREETLKKFHEDVGLEPDELRIFAESVQPLMRDMQQNMMKRMQEKGASITPDDQSAIMTDVMAETGAKIRDEAKKTFSNAKFQKLHMRMFQLLQGTIDATAKSNDINVVMGAMGGNTLLMAAGQPDILELTADQKKQIAAIQRDVSIKTSSAIQEGMMKAVKDHPELMKKRGELYAKLNAPETTPEEKSAIGEQIQELQLNMMVPAMEGIKKILADGKTRYWRVLTDSQKAKYEQLMADIPDYLWQRMPQNAGKDRDWRPGLGSWIPGMGAPEGTENIREARPQRPERERRFPGSE